jgi:hypothetical protein
VQAMLHLQDNKPKKRHTKFPTAILFWIWMVKIGAKKRCEVWASLRDDEMVHVEEFGNTMQR